MAIQWVAESDGLQFEALCVEGWHAEWDAGPDEGEIGSDGVRIGLARGVSKLVWALLQV